MITRWLLFYLLSGQSFFTGAACLIAAAGLSHAAKPGPNGRRARTFRNMLAAAGVILIGVSSTPLPPALYGALGLAFLLWMAAEWRRTRLPGRAVGLVRGVLVLACVAAVCTEWPWHLLPRLPALGRPVLGIVGDSITAGMGERHKPTWPALFAARHGVEVRDRAAVGATVATALRQAEFLGPDVRLVLLEIGGNDLLGGTSPAEFDAGLERLLAAVCRPGRTVVMLELPLPPGCHRFGLSQRRRARMHGVTLVPKRVLLSILQQGGTTVDTIHLSPEGHSQMADTLWHVLQSAFDGDAGTVSDRGT